MPAKPAPASARTTKAAPPVRYRTFADVLARVGNVPAERILSYPAAGTATVQDLLDPLVTAGRMCELVDGILVEKTMGYREGRLGLWIGSLLNFYLVTNNIGCAAGPEGMIRFNINVVRSPDVSFIRWDSVDDPGEIENPAGACLEYPPDFVIEVLSPGNTPEEMAIKLAEYAKAGVKLVWYVDPVRQEVDVYQKSRVRGKKTVGIDGTLDGGAVLPGFALPVAKIFEKRAPAKKKQK